jgi:hypothetical protein
MGHKSTLFIFPRSKNVLQLATVFMISNIVLTGAAIALKKTHVGQ